MSQIYENIYVGSVYDLPNISENEYLIINVADEINSPKAKYNFNLTDDEREIDYLEVYKIMKKISNIIQTKTKDKNIFIHCQMGRCRSVSAIIYYLMMEKGLSFDQALNKFKDRPVNIHNEYT